MDIYEVKQYLNKTLPKAWWAKATPFWSSNIKGPQKTLVYLPCIGEILKARVRDYSEKPDQLFLGTVLGRTIKLQIDEGSGFLGLTLHWGPKVFIHKSG